MGIASSYTLIAAATFASLWCWWLISRSGHSPALKLILTLLAAIPIVGPLLYLFVGMPPRRHASRTPGDTKPNVHRIHGAESAFLRTWNAREHVYLGWASVVLWALAILVYWMSGWSPGRVHAAPFNLGHFTDVDVIFHALLIGAVLTLGAAYRAKAALSKALENASNLLLQPTGKDLPAAE